MKRARLFKDGKPAPEPSPYLTPEFEAAWAAHDTSAFHSRKAHYAEVFAWGRAAEQQRITDLAWEHRGKFASDLAAGAFIDLVLDTPKDKP